MSRKERRKLGAEPPPPHPGGGAPKGTETKPPEAPGDAAERARLMAKAQEMIEQAPEIRAEKVAALKEAVKQGTYQIDSRRLANIILVLLLTED
jgi:flagellar biosynthesis anti-sigma factor FlgM